MARSYSSIYDSIDTLSRMLSRIASKTRALDEAMTAQGDRLMAQEEIIKAMEDRLGAQEGKMKAQESSTAYLYRDMYGITQAEELSLAETPEQIRAIIGA